MAEDPSRLTRIPETVGGVVDRLYTLKQRKAKLTKISNKIEEEEKLLKEKVINLLDKDDAVGISGKFGKAKIISERMPYAESWDKLQKHIVETGEFDLMQKRLSVTAVRERDEAIPGIKFLNVKKVSLTKA